MGNREDLLAGARKAIVEKGVAGATARDIAGAAGVSLAAIGYHFGSKERLITEALAEAMGREVGDGLEALIREAGAGRSLPQAFPITWNGVPELLRRNREGLMLSFENGVRIARSPELQRFMGDATPTATRDIAAVLREVHPDIDAEQAQAVAQLYFLLLQGLAVLWLLSPDGELSDGDTLALAVSALS